MTRLSSADVGCWIEGSWGQYATARMVSIAVDYGYADYEVIALATAHLSECLVPGTDAIEDDGVELLFDAADEVESWLNSHVAPEGFCFGWHDGEFFLQSEGWWEEDD